MAVVTKKGRELAWKLNPAIGSTRKIDETCSLICRHATTHHWLQEVACNREMDRHEEVKEARIEARITYLVATLPATDDGPWRVEFQGDPRGVTVKLHAPPEWHHLYDGWAGEAICVPQ